MKLKIKNIPASFLFGLFFLFILSFSVSSAWAAYPSCHVTGKSHRPTYNAPVWDLVQTCNSNRICYKRHNLSASIHQSEFGKCLPHSTPSNQQHICDTMCDVGAQCFTRRWSLSGFNHHYLPGASLFFNNVTCTDTCSRNGLIYNGSGCSSSCPAGKVPNANHSGCRSCPSNQVAKNGNCTCPSDQVYRGGSCQGPVTTPTSSGGPGAQACASLCPSSSSNSCSFDDDEAATPGKNRGESKLSYRKVICN